MSLTTSEMTPADIAAVTGNNSGNMFGGDGAWWIIILFLFVFCGWGNNNGGFGGGSNSGAADNYVLASDFATIQRQLSDGFNSIDNALDRQNTGICNLGYTQAQLINGVQQGLVTQGYETRSAINGIGAQMAQCCCDIREGISGVNYNLAMNANATQRAISDGFCQTNFNMATQNNQTLQAIDKVGDRVIDYLANQEAQKLRDDNFALRLAASQQAQNNYLVSQLGQKCPIPAYLTCNPNAPLNYSVNYGCGCNG